MLPIHQLCNTRQLQKALAVANHGPVTKQATVHAAAAAFCGFDNMTTALALTDRFALNRDRLWCEYAHFDGCHVIYANGHEIAIDRHLVDRLVVTIPDGVVYSNVIAALETLSEVPAKDPRITYDHKSATVTLYGDNRTTIAFTRAAANIVRCTLSCKGRVLMEGWDDVSDTQDTVFWDEGSQLPRLLDEMVAVGAETDFALLSQETGLSEQALRDTMDTASWLYEKSKGNDDEAFLAELKPARTLSGPIGLVAYTLWEHGLKQDRDALLAMSVSMGLGRDDVEFLVRMAYADGKRYQFTAYDK